MIYWYIQSVADHPYLAAGRPPVGLLTPEEMDHYNGYFSPRRRRDWLLGRWTAKRLIQATIARHAGWRPPLDSFSIGQADSGAPFVRSDHPALCGSCSQGYVPMGISISHSHGHAFCAVTLRNGTPLRLGADIELIDRRNPNHSNDFFTPEEKVRLDTMPSAYYTLMATATHSAKEAVLKATQVGMRADSHIVQCFLRPDRPRHWTPYLIELSSSKVDVRACGSQAFNGWWRILENRLRPGSQFVLTLAAQGATL